MNISQSLLVLGYLKQPVLKMAMTLKKSGAKNMTNKVVVKKRKEG